jgi:hypothetical protein
VFQSGDFGRDAPIDTTSAKRCPRFLHLGFVLEKVLNDKFLAGIIQCKSYVSVFATRDNADPAGKSAIVQESCRDLGHGFVRSTHADKQHTCRYPGNQAAILHSLSPVAELKDEASVELVNAFSRVRQEPRPPAEHRI